MINFIFWGNTTMKLIVSSIHKFENGFYRQNPRIERFEDKVTELTPHQLNQTMYEGDKLKTHYGNLFGKLWKVLGGVVRIKQVPF